MRSEGNQRQRRWAEEYDDDDDYTNNDEEIDENKKETEDNNADIVTDVDKKFLGDAASKLDRLIWKV